MSRKVAVSQLRECHGEILVPTGEAARFGISAVARHAMANSRSGRKLINWEKMVRPSFTHHVAGGVRLGSAPLAFEIAATSNRKQLSTHGRNHYHLRTLGMAFSRSWQKRCSDRIRLILDHRPPDPDATAAQSIGTFSIMISCCSIFFSWFSNSFTRSVSFS